MIGSRGRGLGPGRLEKRGDQWTLDWKDASGRRRRQALSRDKGVAERARIQILAARDAEMCGLSGQEGQARPLSELVALYLDDLAGRSVPRHVVNTRAHLEALIAALPVKIVRDLRAIHLMQHRAKRVAEGVATRTANLQVTCFKAMLNWCVAAELIGRNPVAHLKALPENESTKRYKRRALSDKEIEAFLAAAREDDASCARHHRRVPQEPLWHALLATGGRYNEIVRARWSDVDLDHGLLILRASNTKSRKERTIPLLGGLVADLRALRESHVEILRRPLRPDDFVFRTARGCAWPSHTVNVTRILQRLLERAGIDRLDAQGKRVDVHALRHSFASRLARSGVSITHAQRLLGHATVELTAQTYTHLSVEDLRGAIQKTERTQLSSRREAS